MRKFPQRFYQQPIDICLASINSWILRDYPPYIEGRETNDASPEQHQSNLKEERLIMQNSKLNQLRGQPGSSTKAFQICESLMGKET